HGALRFADPVARPAAIPRGALTAHRGLVSGLRLRDSGGRYSVAVPRNSAADRAHRKRSPRPGRLGSRYDRRRDRRRDVPVGEYDQDPYSDVVPQAGREFACRGSGTRAQAWRARYVAGAATLIVRPCLSDHDGAIRATPG